MIIEEFTTGVRILLEKSPSRYNISKDQQSRKIPEVPISPEDGSSQKERAR
jgi:hypothetical protein